MQFVLKTRALASGGAGFGDAGSRKSGKCDEQELSMQFVLNTRALASGGAWLGDAGSRK